MTVSPRSGPDRMGRHWTKLRTPNIQHRSLPSTFRDGFHFVLPTQTPSTRSHNSEVSWKNYVNDPEKNVRCIHSTSRGSTKLLLSIHTHPTCPDGSRCPFTSSCFRLPTICRQALLITLLPSGSKISPSPMPSAMFSSLTLPNPTHGGQINLPMLWKPSKRLQ